MVETLLAIAIAVGLLAFGLATAIPFETASQLAWLLIGVGFGIGVPAGVVYHVLLYRALKPRGLLDANWLLHPISYNRFLRDDERFAVLAWCYFGAFCFSVIAIGITIYLGAALRLFASA